MSKFLKIEFDQQTKDEFNKLHQEFKSEGDRSTVILGVAKLDVLLYQLLTKVLVPNSNRKDDLFDDYCPLSTFSSKTDLAFRLGLIDDNFCRALHLIGRIRNTFAHELSGATLDSGGHRDRVRELCMPLLDYQDFEDFRINFFDNKKDISTDFRIILCITILRLEVAVSCSNSIKPDACTFVPPKWTTENKQTEEVDQKTKVESQPPVTLGDIKL